MRWRWRPIIYRIFHIKGPHIKSTYLFSIHIFWVRILAIPPQPPQKKINYEPILTSWIKKRFRVIFKSFFNYYCYLRIRRRHNNPELPWMSQENICRPHLHPITDIGSTRSKQFMTKILETSGSIIFRKKSRLFPEKSWFLWEEKFWELSKRHFWKNIP